VPEQPDVVIYTDGACRGNPGPGGWGAVLSSGRHEKTLAGFEAHTTNNRMELLAAIRGLQALTKPCAVTIWTDSQYLRQGITSWIHSWARNGWVTSARQPVKNADLWQELLAETKRHEVAWNWVRGHNGDPGNERADKLATGAIDAALDLGRRSAAQSPRPA
jgi:ribonuclease HI